MQTCTDPPLACPSLFLCTDDLIPLTLCSSDPTTPQVKRSGWKQEWFGRLDRARAAVAADLVMTWHGRLTRRVRLGCLQAVQGWVAGEFWGNPPPCCWPCHHVARQAGAFAPRHLSAQRAPAASMRPVPQPGVAPLSCRPPCRPVCRTCSPQSSSTEGPPGSTAPLLCTLAAPRLLSWRPRWRQWRPWWRPRRPAAGHPRRQGSGGTKTCRMQGQRGRGRKCTAAGSTCRRLGTSRMRS